MARGWNGPVAAAAVDITPTQPLPLAGSAAARGSSTGIEDRLEASVLVLPGAQPVVLASLDALFTGPVVVATVEERLSGLVAPEAVLLFASHTHSAPALDPGKPRLGEADPAYVATVAKAIGDAARRLLDEAHPCALSTASARERFGVRRRRRQVLVVRRSGIGIGRFVQGIDRAAPVDDAIVLARFDDAAGRPVAVVWGLACHPVGHPRSGLVSAHYPGVVRERLRAALDAPDLPVLFLQGFSGDVRPREESAMRPTRSGLARLAHGPAFGPLDAAGYASWCGTIADRVVAMAGAAEPSAPGAVELGAVDLPRSRFAVPGDGGDVAFRALRIGEGFVIVGVGVEAVSAYAAAARAIAPDAAVIAAGCLGDVVGYAPTAAMLAKGGYEAEGFCPDFGIAAVAAGVEDAMREGLAALARR